MEQRADFVRKKGDQWCVYSEDGVEIACHDTEEAANRQLRAIEAAKHARQGSRTDGKRVVFRQDFARSDGVAARIDRRSPTPHRGLRVEGRISRVGVYTYDTFEGKKWREYHAPEEVFDEAALASFADAPVTDLHPGGFVDPENWASVAVGHVASAPVRDGDFVRATMVLSESRAIRRVATEERQELSPGYTVVVDATPGSTPEGEEYDAVAREIRANHVAIGPANWARGGRDTRILADSRREGTWITREQMALACPPCAEKMDALHMREVRVDQMPEDLLRGLCEKFGDAEGFRTRCMESSIPVDDLGGFCNWLKGECHGDGGEVMAEKMVIDGVEHEVVGAGTRHAVERLVAERDNLRGKVDSLDVALREAKARLAEVDSPKRIQDAVRARVDLEQRARKILGAEERLEDFSDRQIMERALLKGDPRAKFDGMSDDYVLGRFDDAVRHVREREVGGGVSYDQLRIAAVPTTTGGAPSRWDDRAASRALARASEESWKRPFSDAGRGR